MIGFGISQGVFFAELRGSFSGHFFEDLREVETIMESGCIGNLLNAQVGLFQKMDRFLNLKTEDMVSRARMKMHLKNAVEAGDAQAGDFCEIVAIQFRGEIPLYNGVNLINGYDTLSINTPSEVIAYED